MKYYILQCLDKNKQVKVGRYQNKNILTATECVLNNRAKGPLSNIFRKMFHKPKNVNVLRDMIEYSLESLEKTEGWFKLYRSRDDGHPLKGIVKSRGMVLKIRRQYKD